MAFWQLDNRNTFTEILAIVDDFQWGATIVGFASLGLLVAWDQLPRLKKSLIPGSLVVVIIGVTLSELFSRFSQSLSIDATHLVNVPVTESFAELFGSIQTLDFSALARIEVWQGGILLAMVASLETLLNLEAVDKVDPYSRNSPPNRELIAQGVGNLTAAFAGGLPMSSVIVRSTVNINAGGQTRWSPIFHGLLLAGCVVFLPTWLNRIPVSCLAAILFFTGFKLASPNVVRNMWNKGWDQFIPFAFTVVAIIFSNLLYGVIAGLVVAIAFILARNVRRPLRRVVEKHAAGEVLRLELANQVSFLNRAAIEKVLDEVPDRGNILIDATGTNYIDPDILEIIHEFQDKTAPARNITVSLKGFHERYHMEDRIQFVDFTTRELQRALTPTQVMQILRDGNQRFRSGQRLTRDLGRQVEATASGQFPLAAVLSCMDSRAPAELLFDLGLGDIFSIRIGGNVASRKIIGSLEYACAVAGSKLILVLGHSRCGAVTAAVENARSGLNLRETTGCEHLAALVADLRQSINGFAISETKESFTALVEEVSWRNILRSIEAIRAGSPVLAGLEKSGQIAIVGAKYDVASGNVDFLPMEGTAQLFESPSRVEIPAIPAAAD
jgi:carbonic anhydrase/SulP family sulfate permease